MNRFELKPVALIAIAFFFVSMLLRLVGWTWGLPSPGQDFSLHPDEYPNAAFSQQIDLAKGKLTPGVYNYGTLYFTVLKVAGDVAITYGGNPEKPNDRIALVHKAGRFLNLVFGSLLPVVAWLALSRRGSWQGAGLAAGMLAVAPALTVHARFQTVDMLALLLSLGGLVAAFNILDEDQPALKWALLAGTFCGLSAGTKYVGIVGLVPIFVALGLRLRGGAITGILGAIVVAGVAFVVATPGALLDREAFWRDFQFELDHTKTGHGIVFSGTPNALVYHLGNFVLGFGALASILGIAGLLSGVKQKDRIALLSLVFFVVYLVVISRAEIKFMRYVLPLFLPLAIGIGRLVQNMSAEVSEKTKKLALAGVALSVAGVDRGGFLGSVQFAVQMSLPDTRTVVANYLKEDPSKSVGIVSDPWFWTPTMYPETAAPRFAGPERIQAFREASSIPVVQYIPESGIADRYDWDTRLLSELKPDRVVFSSFETQAVDRIAALKKAGRTFTDVESLLADRYSAFAEQLSKDYEVEKVFNPKPTILVEDMEYVGPTVWVWKKKGS